MEANLLHSTTKGFVDEVTPLKITASPTQPLGVDSSLVATITGSQDVTSSALLASVLATPLVSSMSTTTVVSSSTTITTVPLLTTTPQTHSSAVNISQKPGASNLNRPIMPDPLGTLPLNKMPESRPRPPRPTTINVINPVVHSSYHAAEFPPHVTDKLLPLFSQRTDLLSSSHLFLPHGSSGTFKSWPRPSTEWTNWINRLIPTYETQWENVGVWDLVMLSKKSISIQSHLLENILGFWAPSCNCFLFPFGPMSVTLMDVMLLTGLPVTGTDIPAAITVDPKSSISEIRCNYSSYTAAAKFWLNQQEDPSSVENTIFLWCLLCKYLFCPISGKPSSQYLPLACHLGAGQSCNLGVICLGALYHGLNHSLSNEPLSKLSGVSWLLQIWAFSYFPRLRNSSDKHLSFLDAPALMSCQSPLSNSAMSTFFKQLTFDQLAMPLGPNWIAIDLTRFSWVGYIPELRNKTACEIDLWLRRECVHIRLLVIGGIFPFDNSGLAFELYNPHLFSRQLGFSQLVPPQSFYYPIDLSPIASEIDKGCLSEETVNMLAALPRVFSDPIIAVETTQVGLFQCWWQLKYEELTRLQPPSTPSTRISKRKLATKKTPLHEKVDKSQLGGSSKKAKQNIKEAKTPCKKKEVETIHRRYSTRRSLELVSGTDLCVDTKSQDIEDLNDESMTILCGKTKENDDLIGGPGHVEISAMDLSFRRARLKLIGEPEHRGDLNFLHLIASSSVERVERSLPSEESVNQAKIVVKNFLDLGLRELGESQRLAMLYSVPIIKNSLDFSTPEFNILDSLSDIFSQSDAADVELSDIFTQLASFTKKRQQTEDLDKQDKSIRDEIRMITSNYDAEEIEMQKEMQKHRERMVTWLERAEVLERILNSNRQESHSLRQQLLGLKDSYQTLIKNLQNAQAIQSDCLSKWKQLSILFS